MAGSSNLLLSGSGPTAIWHSDEDGFYDVQRPEAEEASLRARFRIDAEGRFHFWTITPTAYPVPDDGPVGDMLKATGRHPMRPAL